jgi:hypothetical protein
MKIPLSKRFVTLILTCALISPTLPALGSVPDETTTITLDQTVHFSGTDGSPVVAEPGDYSVESTQEWLRLTPGTERRDALLIQAEKGTHEVKIEVPIVISTPGSEEDELDTHVVQLLNPDGTSMVAAGTYSGIQPRGFLGGLSNAAKKAAARARAAAAAAAAKAKRAAASAKAAALKAKQAAEQAARAAAAAAKIAACKATVGMIKGGQAVAGFMKNVIPAIQSKKKSAQNRFRNDKNFHDQLIAKITQNLQAHQAKIPELKKVAAIMNASKSKLDSIFSVGNFCGDSVATMDQKLKSLGLVPNFALVQSRGVNDEHFYLGYQITLGGGVGAGMQVGLMGVTDLRGNGGKYWFIGPQGITNAAVGVTAEVAFFPKVSLDSFQGWGSGVGISAGPPSKVVSGAVDVMLDEKVDKFQGFGFGPGAGVGVSPVDAAFSYTHSWKY